MLPYLLFGGSLALVGLLLAWWQHRQWLVDAALEPEGREESGFLKAQYRRRMTMAALVAATGIAIATGRFIGDPLWAGIYWLGVILVVLVTMIVAVIDFLAGHERYLAASDQLQAEEAKLRKQLKELQAREGNGAE